MCAPAVLHVGPAAIDYLEARTNVRFVPCVLGPFSQIGAVA